MAEDVGVTRPVVVVGDVAVDVLVCAAGAVRPGTDTPATVRTIGGGAGANAAAWLARLGVPVTLVARVGDDPAGHQQVAALGALGVRCAVAVDPSEPTATVLVLVGADGERTMLTDRGANCRLSVADLPELPAGGHMHVSGYSLLDVGSRPAALAALAAAREAGLTISVDPASTAPLAAAGTAEFLSWTRGADLLLPNLAEARLLSGHDDPHAAATALATGYGAVAVTLGAAGALWACGPETVLVPAVPAEVVDTTGAGDAFTAGLLAAWLAGEAGPMAVRAGTALAAGVVNRLGARP